MALSPTLFPPPEVLIHYFTFLRETL